MSKTLLEIENISISYDKKKSYILKDTSFSLSEWEVLSIIGKNGTGKSSLLKAIAGIQEISSGSIKKHSKNIASSEARFRNDVSYFGRRIFSYISSWSFKKRYHRKTETFWYREITNQKYSQTLMMRVSKSPHY